MRDTPIARITGCVSSFIKDVGRRLPLQLQCSYQGQQGDVRKSVRGNYKTRFGGGQNLTAVERNASVYQVNPVSRITGKGRAKVLTTWGPDIDQKGGGRVGGVHYDVHRYYIGLEYYCYIYTWCFRIHIFHESIPVVHAYMSYVPVQGPHDTC